MREVKFIFEYVKVGVYLGVLEMIWSGIMIFLDMYFYMDKVVEVVFDVGLRGYFFYGMIDFGDLDRIEKELKEVFCEMEVIEKLNFERVYFVFGFYVFYICLIVFLKEVRKFVSEYNKFIIIYVSEMMVEIG